MKRLLPILSLFPCIALAALWLSSHRLAPYDNGITCFDIGHEPNRFVIQAYHGFLICSGQPTKCDLLVFNGRSQLIRLERHLILLPIWLPTLLAAIPPILLILCLARQLRRRHLHLCPHCGYDLRASHDRCPECGAPIPADPPTTPA